MSDVLVLVGIFAVAVGMILGAISWNQKQEEDRRLSPPTKCVLGYTMIRVGNSWVYQLADNQQVPCK